MVLFLASDVDRTPTRDGVQPWCEWTRRVERRGRAPGLDHRDLDGLLGEAAIATERVQGGGQHRPGISRVQRSERVTVAGREAATEVGGIDVDRKVLTLCGRP